MKTIQYVNFEPPETTETFGREKFEEIFEKAPSDAYVMARAEQESENRFHAVLECRACDVGFSVEAVGNSSYECIQDLYDQAKVRLADWRSHRFDHLEQWELAG